VKDELSNAAKHNKDSYWLILSTDPVAQAEQVVNLRFKQLQREHTTESFIDFTPYVANWDKTESNGRTIFSTTVGTQEAK
jgi:hypothetical protein